MEERSELEEIVGVETPDNFPCHQRAPDMLHVKKVDFLAFIAFVINCTTQLKRKS